MVKDWKESWTDKERINFVPDGAYFSEEAGGYVVVESITNSYSQQDVEQKETFVNTFYGGRMVRV